MEQSPDLVKVLVKLRARADQQPDSEYYLKTFVPVLDFGALAAPNTQIIYGRNGTGKTHLLKAFCEYASDKYETEKILPIYIDCKTLELGTVGAEIEVAYLVQRYYRLFVAKIVDALLTLAREVLTPKLLDRIFGSEETDRLNNIQNEIRDLHKIFRFERIEERPKETLIKLSLSTGV